MNPPDGVVRLRLSSTLAVDAGGGRARGATPWAAARRGPLLALLAAARGAAGRHRPHRRGALARTTPPADPAANVATLVSRAAARPRCRTSSWAGPAPTSLGGSWSIDLVEARPVGVREAAGRPGGRRARPRRVRRRRGPGAARRGDRAAGRGRRRLGARRSAATSMRCGVPRATTGWPPSWSSIRRRRCGSRPAGVGAGPLRRAGRPRPHAGARRRRPGRRRAGGVRPPRADPARGPRHRPGPRHRRPAPRAAPGDARRRRCPDVRPRPRAGGVAGAARGPGGAS